jgi:cell division septation protein DedD
MTDARADDLNEEDRLPWLEAVEEEDEREGPSALKLIAAVIIGLLCIGAVVGTLFWLGNRGARSGTELIPAPEGAYKVAPDDPGGMQVQGEGDTSQAASQGADPQGNLAMRTPEAPVAGPQAAPAPAPAQAQPQAQAQAQAQPQPQPQPRPAPAPQPAAPAQPQASGPSATVQLGAFSSQASATGAWGVLAGRFRYLAPLSHSVVPAQVGGRTLYRLRANGPGAGDICRRLQVAGEDCTVVQ